MKIETFTVSVACKDDVRREDLAASIYGFLNRNLIDTTYAYAAEVDGSTASKAPDALKIAARPADQPKKRRTRRTKAEILAAMAGRGELTAVERRGQVPAGANAPAHSGPVLAV
jgi:hypothetical protein